MAKNICVLQGHPHSSGAHLCHALAESYVAGAKSAGAKVETVDLGALDVEILHNPADFATPPVTAVRKAQEAVTRCHHLLVVYPLWLGTMPALVKAFFEQLSRNEFAISSGGNGWPRKMLKGRSARVVVTMGMPAPAYKLIFGAHGVRGFESGILGMAGFKPVRETLIGGVGELKQARVDALMKRLKSLGAQDAGGA
ncbi:MAG: NAD(P)H-dependent oxidoreductase [Dongiaceae bacterium]